MSNDKMKEKHAVKLKKYLVKNDLPKMKSYIKKHSLEKEGWVHCRLDGDATFLHLACRHGHETIVRYLLKKGSDALLLDGEGNLPLHLACAYTSLTMDKFAFTDLVLPLISHSQESLDVPNRAGKTCRQLIEDIKRNNLEEMTPPNGSAAENSSKEEREKESWEEKLQREMESEFADYGDYEQYYEDTGGETWNEWADRLNREHYQKKRYGSWPKDAPSPAGGSSYRSMPGRTTRGGDSDYGRRKPKISAKKKRRFQEHLEEENRAEIERRARKKLKQIAVDKEVYESKCRELFSGDQQTRSEDGEISKDVLLKFSDIPWPLTNICRTYGPQPFATQQIGTASQNIEDFLFGDLEKGSGEYRKYLKVQQVRWHPDRFTQKCGHKLLGKDKEKILNQVKEISQILNKMSETAQ